MKGAQTKATETSCKPVFPEMRAIWDVPSPYVKDGLIPITEWLGPSPWSDRAVRIIARRIVQAFRKPAADPRVAIEESLVPREQEMLRLLAKGCLQKEISDQLGISFPTVRTLAARIYTKLHVQSRSQAVAKYLGESGG